ncbi:16S rRNA (uracil(1498)-N(3))-methyltransferase [Patescibacteria group bacterium]|nr:MAG: 16S rRNA (uracil(1498)-N(3))-methyltransferase [Patescibacteria group bacterium]
MRLHRFFVSKSLEDKEELTIHDSELWNQLKNVLRFTIGGQVILFDGSGQECLALISSFARGDVSFEIASRRMSRTIPSRELHLAVALLKKDKLEWVFEKGTELGVARFLPILASRSEKKDLNRERLDKIVKEAVEQSGRALIPTVENTSSLEEALLRELPALAFDAKGERFVVERARAASLIVVFIGPEGGWTERELFLFKKHKVPVHSLGAATLRSETAALAAASLLLL